MDLWMLLLSACVMGLVSASVMVLLQWLWPDAGLQRLSIGQQTVAADTGTALRHGFGRWLNSLPEWARQLLWRMSRWSLPAASGPDEAVRQNMSEGLAPTLSLQLLQAGWRSPQALWLWGAGKSLLTLLGLVLGALLSAWQGQPVLGAAWWLLSLGMAAAGYWLPSAWLQLCILRRRRALFRAFPDALDMLRICVQAGLGLDAAIERVGREMQLSSPVLSEEWRLTGLELRAGASRRQALQHLAERVGLREVDAMVTMLIQADRFGTRMSEALKVHAEVLRTQRQQQAETAAAQLPVKLLIPLIFCIFPALLTVILGPVALSLIEHFAQAG